MPKLNILSDISSFNAINSLVEEYYDDKSNLNPNKLIMQYYHRMFVLLVASTFERKIKDSIDYFISNSVRNYPNIKIRNSESAYKKFHTDPILDANPFYNLFVGIGFESNLIVEFNQHMNNKKIIINQKIQDFNNINIHYDELENISIILDETDFSEAEQAFLRLKFYRNQVAHNFLTNNFSNTTFNEIKEYYYKSMYYVEALEKLIQSL